MYIAITILKISCIHESVGQSQRNSTTEWTGLEGEVEWLDEHEDVNGVDKKKREENGQKDMNNDSNNSQEKSM